MNTRHDLSDQADQRILALVRHGHSTANHGDALLSRRNPRLSDQGRGQAEGAAEVLLNLGLAPASLTSSPLLRAWETGEIIARTLDRSLGSAAELQELDFGELEGQVLRDHPELLARWRTAPADLVFPGGESLAQAAARVRAWLDRECPGPGLHILITHCFVGLGLLCDLLGSPLDRFRGFHLTHGGISLVNVTREPARLLALNL